MSRLFPTGIPDGVASVAAEEGMLGKKFFVVDGRGKTGPACC